METSLPWKILRHFPPCQPSEQPCQPSLPTPALALTGAHPGNPCLKEQDS